MKSKRYLQAIPNADYADDLALHANTPIQAEFLLHNLERAARGIGLYVSSNKTEFMRFNQDYAISSLNIKSLKLIN